MEGEGDQFPGTTTFEMEDMAPVMPLPNTVESVMMQGSSTDSSITTINDHVLPLVTEFDGSYFSRNSNPPQEEAAAPNQEESPTKSERIFFDSISITEDPNRNTETSKTPTPYSYIQDGEQRDKTGDLLADFIDNQLTELQNTYQEELNCVYSSNQTILQNLRKTKREIKKMSERNESLNKTLLNLQTENSVLREKISSLGENISSDDQHLVSIFRDIKEKLLGDTINISAEKKKRISLLKRLSQTRFKSTNGNHCALLQRLWNSHSPLEWWSELGFESESPGDEFGKTGILALHNLVYFSERYNDIAKDNAAIQHQWAHGGIAITTLLTSLLHLHGDKGFFSDVPPNGIFRTFINLMDHQNAFEELFCICLMIYDNAIRQKEVDPLVTTRRKLQELLQYNPKDLHDLIRVAKCL